MNDLPTHRTVPTSQYTYDELADIYNQARVDYIVPMPMNGKRMQEYVTNYSVDLDSSVVALDVEDGQPLGVGMLGIRDNRAWITRLGVIPRRRKRGTGQFLMESMIDQARQRSLQIGQLEVIKGNTPALKLFLKLGFVETRELLIIRRPPGEIDENLMKCKDAFIKPIDDQIEEYLAMRDDDPSWLEETSSLLNAGKLRGFYTELPNGDSGWIVFQCTPFQLTHFVTLTHTSEDVMRALVCHIHKEFPFRDTKIENVPADHPTWPTYQKLGYIEVFRRIEMFLQIAP